MSNGGTFNRSKKGEILNILPGLTTDSIDEIAQAAAKIVRERTGTRTYNDTDPPYPVMSYQVVEVSRLARIEREIEALQAARSRHDHEIDELGSRCSGLGNGVKSTGDAAYLANQKIDEIDQTILMHTERFCRAEDDITEVKRRIENLTERHQSLADAFSIRLSGFDLRGMSKRVEALDKAVAGIIAEKTLASDRTVPYGEFQEACKITTEARAAALEANRRIDDLAAAVRGLDKLSVTLSKLADSQDGRIADALKAISELAARVGMDLASLRHRIEDAEYKIADPTGPEPDGTAEDPDIEPIYDFLTGEKVGNVSLNDGIGVKMGGFAEVDIDEPRSTAFVGKVGQPATVVEFGGTLPNGDALTVSMRIEPA